MDEIEVGWSAHRALLPNPPLEPTAEGRGGSPIALRTTEGNCNSPERDNIEEWLFNDAPRWLRIDAIDKIPNLIDKLIAEADDTSKKIKEKPGSAKQLAAALNQAATDLVQQRKAAGSKS